MSYSLIKQNYIKGLWNVQMVAICVKKGLISPEQYAEITGNQYTA